MNSYNEIYVLNSHMKYMYELIILNQVNEGQRQRIGSLSLQVKSGASTVRAASSRTSSRHIYISYIEFIVLIHIINSHTKIIALIHIISSLQASSTCLSMSTRISWHIGRQLYCKADPVNAITERYLRKMTALWSVFCTAQTMVPPLQAQKRLTCGMSSGT
jgi:hypothetical protein